MANLYPFFRPLVKACLCSGAVFLTLSTHAQSYYPAGLGNGTLQLWLTAADPTTLLNAGGTPAANGDFIATWKDKSGRGADATQSTGGIQPVYWTNQLNGFGALIFTSNTQYLTGPKGAYQTIVSTRAINGFGYNYLFSSPALTDFSVRLNQNGSPTANSWYTMGPNSQDWCWNNYVGGLAAMWINGKQTTSFNTTTHILVDEAQGPTNATYSISNTFSNRGMQYNDPVYELIAYNGTPNNTQRVLLENYQASEWGLTGYLPSSGYTIFTPPTSSTYNRNLVGIGDSGSDNFLADVAGSTDGLGFSSGSTASDFLGWAGYAMAAHNAQTNKVNYNPILNKVPAGSYVWNRSWYVQLSGGNSAGNITLNFNFSDYNGTSPNPVNNFALLYNPSDGTFASGTNTLVSTVTTTVSGSSVSFVVNAANLANGYYTIVYNPISVLAVTLDNFSVTKLSPDAALAKWTVGPGFDRGYFTLQRSTDGLQFTSIGTVDAAAAAKTAGEAAADNAAAGNYSYTDNSPSPGINYYRLAMVNAAGVLSYSPTGILTFGEPSHMVTLYPIPTKDILHISAPGISGARNIDLVSVIGQVLESYSVSTLDGTNLSVSRLPAGSYFVRIRGGGQSFVLPFLKR
ncbi:T9SS type A sorting domain-containing protein [Puia dinghuensis]|uniref:T9SS C-terminal target domain-containing protein n=1 Tax=Puia dinghuensis TaxID=1792502 RepID=A0A8J2UII3_9BACT|nr:T9SS type A sorting domain-containing protein [Puia dinghuensis]GGB23204.1 hypothetical protein GCM10011511_53890 [Puia dinghuensis]